MDRLNAYYAVPVWMRFLAGGGAAVVAVSLPMLAGSAHPLIVLLVAASGVFSASIAIFGRKAR